MTILAIAGRETISEPAAVPEILVIEALVIPVIEALVILLLTGAIAATEVTPIVQTKIDTIIKAAAKALIHIAIMAEKIGAVTEITETIQYSRNKK